MQNIDYIKGLQRHDKKILSTIYTDFSSTIKNLVLKSGGNTEDAHDVFQDALIVIFKKTQSTDFQLYGSFGAYFYQVCRFIWDRKRKKKSNQVVTFDNFDRYNIVDASVEEKIIEKEKQELYLENLQKLGSTCKQILNLYFAKKTMTEIAEKLGFKNARTVSTKKHKCLKSLTALIKADKRLKAYFPKTAIKH